MPSSGAVRRWPSGPPRSRAAKLLRLTLGFGLAHPLPRLQIEAGPQVHNVVADGVRHVPSEPSPGQPRPHADDPFDDHLFDPSTKREGNYLKVQFGHQQLEVHGDGQPVPPPDLLGLSLTSKAGTSRE